VHGSGSAHTGAPEQYLIEVVLCSQETGGCAEIGHAIVKGEIAITRAVAGTSLVVPENIEAGGRKGITELPA
jgi:hypothetical protein